MEESKERLLLYLRAGQWEKVGREGGEVRWGGVRWRDSLSC